MARRHFGSVRKLPSGRYQASYYHRAVRHLAEQTFTTKGEAQHWLSHVETTIHQGSWIDPAAGRITVAELAGIWRERDPSKRSSSRARDEAILRLHVLPVLGPIPIREVTPPDVQQLINAWTKQQAPRTVDRQYDVIRAMFGYAVRCDWLVRSPCRDIKLPPVEETRRRDLSVDDVIALADAIDHRYEGMVWLGAVLGLRWGEAAGLTAESLDLVERTITITHQLGRDGRLAPPKSRAGIRQFSIPTELAELLSDHAWEAGIERPEDLVFAAPEGGPLDYSHWRWRIWVPATEKAGLKGTGYHDLRRANASTLVAEGVDIKTAQSRLGHSDPRLTLAVYARAVPEADRAAAEAMGRAFFGGPRASSDDLGDQLSCGRSATSPNQPDIAHGDPHQITAGIDRARIAHEATCDSPERQGPIAKMGPDQHFC